MIDKLQALLRLVILQIESLHSQIKDNQAIQPILVVHTDGLPINEHPPINNPSNKENVWKALNSHLVEFHNMPECSQKNFKIYLIRSILVIFRSLLGIFGDMISVEGEDYNKFFKYEIKDTRIFHRLVGLIKELGLDTEIKLFNSVTIKHDNFIFMSKSVENVESMADSLILDIYKDMDYIPPSATKIISFLSYGIANGKSSTLASFGSLDNGFSAFFRYKFVEFTKLNKFEEKFMPNKFYPIFIHFGLLCKSFHLIKYNRSDAIVSRNWVDHSFFAKTEDRKNFFNFEYYLHLFAHTVAARNESIYTDVYFRMVTYTDDTFFDKYGQEIDTSSPYCCDNLNFPFVFQDVEVTYDLFKKGYINLDDSVDVEEFLRKNAKAVVNSREMENKIFKTKDAFLLFMTKYRSFFRIVSSDDYKGFQSFMFFQDE